MYMCEQVCAHVPHMHVFVHLQHCVHLCELMLFVLFGNMYMCVLYAYVYVSLCMKVHPWDYWALWGGLPKHLDHRLVHRHLGDALTSISPFHNPPHKPCHLQADRNPYDSGIPDHKARQGNRVPALPSTLHHPAWPTIQLRPSGLFPKGPEAFLLPCTRGPFCWGSTGH